MDTHNSKTVPYPDFRKVLNDYKLGLAEADISALFTGFDVSKTGEIDYEEFLRIIQVTFLFARGLVPQPKNRQPQSVQGKMSEYRTEAVQRAFAVLDPMRKGTADLETVKSRYNASKHPDVMNGRKSEDEALFEFLESFDEYHHHLAEHGASGKVTEAEFVDYFANVSACMDDDDEFVAMINNVWRVDEAEKLLPAYQPAPSYEEIKAAPPAAVVPEPRPMVPPLFQQYRSPGKKGTANVASIDNTLQLSAKLYNQLQTTKKEPPVPVVGILANLRKKLAPRGARGILGLANQFKVNFLAAGSKQQVSFKPFTKNSLWTQPGKEPSPRMISRKPCAITASN